jgi:hypothetical protein
MIHMHNRHRNLTLDLFKTIYGILLLEGLAVHPKLFRGRPVDRDRRFAQGWYTVHLSLPAAADTGKAWSFAYLHPIHQCSVTCFLPTTHPILTVAQSFNLM